MVSFTQFSRTQFKTKIIGETIIFIENKLSNYSKNQCHNFSKAKAVLGSAGPNQVTKANNTFRLSEKLQYFKLIDLTKSYSTNKSGSPIIQTSLFNHKSCHYDSLYLKFRKILNFRIQGQNGHCCT